jgi:hypothetical protein
MNAMDGDEEQERLIAQLLQTYREYTYTPAAADETAAYLQEIIHLSRRAGLPAAISEVEKRLKP